MDPRGLEAPIQPQLPHLGPVALNIVTEFVKNIGGATRVRGLQTVATALRLLHGRRSFRNGLCAGKRADLWG
jgi:hypothetical protein